MSCRAGPAFLRGLFAAFLCWSCGGIQDQQETPLAVPELLTQQSLEKGLELARQGRFAAAVAAFQQALKQGMETAQLHFQLGNAALNDDDYTRAAAAYQRERALELDSQCAPASCNLAPIRTSARSAQKRRPSELGSWAQQPGGR